MHEFNFAHQIFLIVLETAEKHNAKIVKSINIEIGDFTLIVPELLEYSFDIVCKGTIAENAKLNIIKKPGTLECQDCKKHSELWLKEPDSDGAFTDEEGNTYTNLSELGITMFKCKHCGSSNTNLVGGKDTKISNIEIEN